MKNKRYLTCLLFLCLTVNIFSSCGIDKTDSFEEAQITTEANNTKRTTTTIFETEINTTEITTKLTSPQTTIAIEDSSTMKYTSLSDDSLGDAEEFIKVLKYKLKSIYNIDDVQVTKEPYSDDNTTPYGDVLAYSCGYYCGCEDDWLMAIFIYTKIDDPQIVTCVMTQMIGIDIFPNSDSKKHNEHLCESLIPMAVFEDYSSQEEMLSHWKKWDDNGSKKLVTRKKYSANYWGEIHFDKDNCNAFFYPINSKIK